VAATVDVHPTAVVDPRAELGEGVVVGPYSVIGPHVVIGNNTRIGAHVVLDGWSIIGTSCEIHHSCVIGTPPQDLKFRDVRSYVRIGDRTVIRELASVNRATGEDEATTIGQDAYLMMYTHVAHNCTIGDHVILANVVEMAGHVTIEDWASVGGITPIHQFVRIGRHSFVGGASRVAQDVPPYIRVAGNPLAVSGLNLVGLERRGFTPDAIRALKRAYRLLYRENLNVSQALERMEQEFPDVPEIAVLVRFIRESTRGITK
jgi:UDP-N-acetylglucosamine acyltransferase